MNIWTRNQTLCAIALSAVIIAVGIRIKQLDAFNSYSLPPGVLIGGTRVLSSLPVTPQIEQLHASALTREIQLFWGDNYHTARLGDLGFELDVPALLHTLQSYRDQPLVARIRLALDARNGKVDVPLIWHLDIEKAQSYLHSLAPNIRREPVDARLDLTGHLRFADTPGAELDEGATLASLQTLAYEANPVIPLVVRSLPASITLEDLARVDVTKMLATYETSFDRRGTGFGRAINIAQAAKKLDGFVLGADEVFSFNQVVGPRTEQAGFTHAPEIIDDEMQDGIGGGTCQVASTLHGAAIFGGLEMIARRSHRRPSAYIPLGLDATVVYGQVDLKIHNPYSFPILIHAFLPTPRSIRIELLGADPMASIHYRYRVEKSEDFYRRITYKPELPSGVVVQHQKGMRGLKAVSVVSLEQANRPPVQRIYVSDYQPVPEVFWLGSGVDETTLPPLPEGVTHVERRSDDDEASSQPHAQPHGTGG